MQIAIDGPAGVGKSTVAKRLAEALDCIYLDTGAMYRAIAYKALKKEQDLSDELLKNIAKNSKIEFNNNKVFIDGEDVTEIIRSREVSAVVSQVAANEDVREELVKQQRKIAQDHSVVMDGRDIGTVVLPKAEYKFFLEASPRCRALRRAKDLKIDSNNEAEILKLEEDIKKRDYSDSTRKVGPLKKAEDAITVVTDDLNPEEVLNTLISTVK